MKGKMTKIKLETSALLESFTYHQQLKSKLLKLINQAKRDKEVLGDDYKFLSKVYSKDKLMTDWSQSEDLNRPWTKLICPFLKKHFNNCAFQLDYQHSKIRNLWFQQYEKGDTHGWHIHGNNYTGVYYLELPVEASKTELINQFNQNRKMMIDAIEGQIIIFPSFIVHRSPKMIKDVRKTIISFNIDFVLVQPSLLNKFK
tara:strand:+ start:166 stop:765 length:600 start_codon:yes stop_codon:yes gene_type:complete